MKKTLLNSIAVLVLAFGSTVVAMADNVVYGLLTGWDENYNNVTQTTSFDLDKVNTSTQTEVPAGFSFSGISEIKCGVTAGDKYYAFVTIMDENYNENVALVTLNFTTGEQVIVNDFSYEYGKPGYSVCGLTYDATNDKLYAIENTWNDNDEYITPLYEVNQETGAMTEVTEWSNAYKAIVANPKGGFYLLKNENSNAGYLPNLYKVSKTFGIDKDPVVSNTTVSTGFAGYNSMVASEDGKNVYLVAGSKVVTFDLDAKTATLKGNLADNVLAVTYGKSSANGTHNEPTADKSKNTRFLVELQTYGTNMGDMLADVDSKREFYFYNTNGDMVGSANYGRNYGEYGGLTEDFDVIDITKNTFDENGLMTSSDCYQWGNYNFNEYCWKKSPNSRAYTYDELGRVVKDSASFQYLIYTYDEDGNVYQKSKYISKTNAWSQTITYSNYNEQGKPEQYVSDGAYDSYKYNGMCTYDENGNKVEEMQYTVTDDPQFPGETITKMKQAERWTYENNILLEYTKSVYDENGEEIPYRRTTYTPVDGDMNVLARADSTYSDGFWTEADLPQRLTYADFSSIDPEMVSIQSMAEADAEQPNTVNIMFTAPALAETQNCNVIVYRDCMPIDTLNVFDDNVYDYETGVCHYQDKTLKNGTYTYFLQPIFAANDEIGELDLDDDMGVDEPATEWTGFYATNPMTVTVHTDLPKVTDLAITDAKVENEGTIIKPQNVYYAGFSWKNPENAEQYGFIKNSLYFVGAGVPEIDTTNIEATKASVMLYDRSEKAYIVTSYQLGKAISDTIDVNFKEIKDLAGIESVTVNGAINATFKSNTVTLSDNANVTVYAVSGQRVFAEDNTKSVSLQNLQPATYIICVEKNGKVNAYKFNVK